MKIEMTNTQRMAVATVIAEYMRTPDPIQEITDCSAQPPVSTKLSELLPLFMAGPWNQPKDEEAKAHGKPAEQSSAPEGQKTWEPGESL